MRSDKEILGKALNLSNEDRLEEAIGLLDEWCTVEGKEQNINRNVIKCLAEFHIKNQNYSGAVRAYRKLRRISTKTKTKYISNLSKKAADEAIAHNHKGAINLLCELIAHDPTHTTGLRNGAIVLKRLGAYTSASEWIKEYLSIKPNCYHGLNTYGTILTVMGKHSDAISAFQRSLSYNPDYADACSNLANEYHLLALIDQAYTYSSKAVFLAPNRNELLVDHLTHLRRVCAFDEIDKVNWWKLFSETSQIGIHNLFLQVLVLAEKEEDQKDLSTLVNNWGDYQESQVSPSKTIDSLEIPICGSEPLNIGFISADFRDHSVARFIWPLFKYLDRNIFNLYGYSTFYLKDKWRERFEDKANAIRDVANLSPLELKKIIQNDNIHILFDLTGFTRGTRTNSLASRISPVQISWLGYPGSSGLPTMDYIFLDRFLEPSDQSHIREKALICPGTTVCFSDIPEIPITLNIPEIVRGYLTLGTLNNSYKITRNTIKRWADVMKELPESKFLFVRREFESFYLRNNIKKEFELNDINSNRIYFFNNAKANRHYLDCYNEIDMSLDTFPVTGGTTTTDALWMGVPVVALEGSNIHQKVCSTILHHAGHPEWIATTDQEFKKIAIDLAMNQSYRIQLRKTLRSEIKCSLLFDSEQFAKDFASTMEGLKLSNQSRS